MLRTDIVMLARFKEGEIGDSQITSARSNLYERVIYRCVIGSRAYGLESDESDTDYRGIYLPPAELHWSLFGVPDQIECDETQEHYWELQRFLVLALKANPNVLECLYTPIVEKTTPLADDLLQTRSIFLSRLVYQTFNGYVISQLKKMQADIRNQGQVKWKHVMHLIRLLISGIGVLRHGFVPVRVEQHRDELLAIKRGEMSWGDTEKWRVSLHAEFDRALGETKLPERPDYEAANDFLIRARRAALADALP
jgi:predicted nucleotidyltransferase